MNDLIEKLRLAVEEERVTEVETMKNEMRHLSGKERERKGRAVLSLRGVIIGEEFGYKLVKFGRKKEIVSEIASGDSIIVSYGDPPQKGFSGTVVETGNRHILVAMESVSSQLFKEARIDLCANDITFSRMSCVLEDLTVEGKRVLDYFLGEREPLEAKKEHASFFDKELNQKQKEAVSRSLSSPDFFLIHGPFGTGKTKTVAELIRQESKRGNRVLACAESNVAVDNLAEELCGKLKAVRIGHPARVSEKTKQITLSFLVQSEKEHSSSLKLREMAESINREQKRYIKPTPRSSRGLGKQEIMKLSFLKKTKKGIPFADIVSMAKWISLEERATDYYEGARAVEENIARRVVSEAEVVLTTNSSCALEVVGDDFDIAVMDEAFQATIPGALIPLSKVSRFILAGDHKQLPPTVISEKAQILKETLFESLIQKYPQKSVFLDIQYRMNETLMRFPSEEFYGGRMKASPEVKNISLSDMVKENSSPSLVFIDTATHKNKPEGRKSDSFSIHNNLEAQKVKEVLLQLFGAGVEPDLVGIITPYDDQAELIRRVCDKDAYTVDGYQGQEKEVIIISFVRSNKNGDLGFLKDMRRLNVSLTRAKRKMVIIGDSQTLRVHPVYERLINYANSLSPSDL